MCGITAFLPKDNAKVNKTVLLALALGNEERGTDSCGISVNKWSKKGVNLSSKFRVLYSKHRQEIDKHLMTSSPVIIHARRSNRFITDEDCAHPFYFYNTKDKNDWIMGCHNGVVTNTEELIKKFCNNTDRQLLKIDSQILMCSLLLNPPEDVLKEYRGDAALIYYTNDNFYVWKGETSNVEERSLHYVETTAGWYFASTSENLKYAFSLVNLVVEPKSVSGNNLLVFSRSGVLEKEISIPRVFKTVTFFPSAHSAFEDNSCAKVSINIQGLYVNDSNGVPLSGEYLTYNKNNISYVYKNSTFPNMDKVTFFQGILCKDVSILKDVLKNLHKNEDIWKIVNKNKEKIKNCIVNRIPFYRDNSLWQLCVKEGYVDYSKYFPEVTYKDTKVAEEYYSEEYKKYYGEVWD